jgi:hypothetical protein
MTWGYCCDDNEEETVVINYFLYIYARLHYTAAPTLFSLLYASSGNDLPLINGNDLVKIEAF